VTSWQWQLAWFDAALASSLTVLTISRRWQRRRLIAALRHAAHDSASGGSLPGVLDAQL
jgi:hypothetical protein